MESTDYRITSLVGGRRLGAKIVSTMGHPEVRVASPVVGIAPVWRPRNAIPLGVDFLTVPGCPWER